MRKTRLKEKTELNIRGILGFLEKRATAFGNGAKVDCPKEFIGRRVYLVICRE